MSENQQDLMIPHIKQNAIIDIKLGTAYINRLHMMMQYLVEGHEEDVKKLEERKGDESNLTPWENAVITITMLLQEILKVAGENNQIEYISLKDSITAMIPNNPLPDSGQPE